MLIIILLLSIVSISSSLDVLYDMPVSNHGARLRMIIRAKKLPQSILSITSPGAIGGLKSEQYLSLNGQGKMPLLVVNSEGNQENGAQYPIAESDCISKYLLSKYLDYEPSFKSENTLQQSLCDQVVRFHDLYISPVQGSMYKASGTAFSTFGSDRKAALNELKKQFDNIERLVHLFSKASASSNICSPYLCGSSISLADVTLFPTMIFCDYMLPLILNSESEIIYKGPMLQKWFYFMVKDVTVAQEVKKEIEDVLDEWKKKDRFGPIKIELNSS